MATCTSVSARNGLVLMSHYCDAGGISGSADAHIVKFSMDGQDRELKEVGRMSLQVPGIAGAAIRSDSRILATAGWDKQVRVFHYSKGRPLAVLQYHKAGVSDVVFDAHTRVLASASKDGTIALWSVYVD